MRRTRMGPGPEFDLVRTLLAAVDGEEADPSVRAGPGDDAAVLEVAAGEQLVLSSDLAVEEVHFQRAWLGWETVGYRAVAAAMSDLAAMAARPLGVLTSVALPPELDHDVLQRLGRGIRDCLAVTGGSVLGGDLSRSPGPVVLDVTAVGAAARPVRRDGAGPGDEVWVTGELGGASAAVADWTRGLEPDARARRSFERPRPRLAEARWLAERAGVTALIDLSDGLAGDARHLAAAGGVRLVLEVGAVPLAPVLEEYADRDSAVDLAVGGGEDFELLMAAPPGRISEVLSEFRSRFGVPLTRLGRVTEGTGVVWKDGSGRTVSPGREGFQHFAGRDGE